METRACFRSVLVDTDLNCEGSSAGQKAGAKSGIVGTVIDLLLNIGTSNDGKGLADVGLEVIADASFDLNWRTGTVDRGLELPLNGLVAQEIVYFTVFAGERPVFAYVSVGIDGEIDGDVALSVP